MKDFLKSMQRGDLAHTDNSGYITNRSCTFERRYNNRRYDAIRVPTHARTVHVKLRIVRVVLKARPRIFSPHEFVIKIESFFSFFLFFLSVSLSLNSFFFLRR